MRGRRPFGHGGAQFQTAYPYLVRVDPLLTFIGRESAFALET